jgi:hypothetical protein
MSYYLKCIYAKIYVDIDFFTGYNLKEMKKDREAVSCSSYQKA